jgi:hypothetical protein
MAVPLTRAKKSPYYFSSGYRPTPPKPAPRPVAPKRTLPGDPNWAQAAEYGWTGSADPNVVTRATPNQYGGLPNTQIGSSSRTNPYANMIGGDWEVAQNEAEMASQMARGRGQLQQSIRTALIDLGVADPSKIGKFSQYIDQDTITQAANNKYSRTAQINQQEATKRAQTDAALAARGMLSSGQLTKSTEDIVASAEGGRYSALRDFLEGGEAGLTGLADLETNLSQGVARARAAAAERAAMMAGWQGPEDWGMGFNYPTEGAFIDRWPGGTEAPAPVRTPPTVAQIYKAMPAAQKKPAPYSPYGATAFRGGYVPKKPPPKPVVKKR